jgi:hypothetical protein
MAYKLRLRSSVLVWSDDRSRFEEKKASTEFKFKEASDMIVLMKNMAVFANEPLDIIIIKEEDEKDD